MINCDMALNVIYPLNSMSQNNQQRPTPETDALFKVQGIRLWSGSLLIILTHRIEWVDYIERHVTIDHNLWGSDQLASVDPVGLFKIVRGVRDIEKALTGYGPRELSESEMPKLKDLR